MDSYVSSEPNARRRNSLNTALKSLNQMVDLHEFDETTQDYTEVLYKGTLSEVSSATINYPRSVGFNIPIIAVVGTLPIVVGYTDGKTLSITSDAFDAKKSSTNTETYQSTTSEKGEDSETKKVVDKAFDNGLKKTTTVITKISYSEAQTDPETGAVYYIVTTEISTTIETDYSDCITQIFMRF